MRNKLLGYSLAVCALYLVGALLLAGVLPARSVGAGTLPTPGVVLPTVDPVVRWPTATPSRNPFPTPHVVVPTFRPVTPVILGPTPTCVPGIKSSMCTDS